MLFGEIKMIEKMIIPSLYVINSSEVRPSGVR